MEPLEESVLSQYSPQSRAERLISVGRLLLSACALLAVVLDPTEPARHARATLMLVGAYVAYSLAIVVLAWRARSFPGRERLGMHALDVALAVALMVLTAGPASPFFAFFVFSLVSATVRWQWHGTVWTGVVLVVAFGAMGLYAAQLLPDFELNRFIILMINLGVVTALLSYVGAYEQRVRREIQMLAAWPRIAAHELEAPVRTILAQCARIVGAGRVLLIWRTEEPWLHVASWVGGEFVWTREPPETFDPPVARELVGQGFLCANAGAPDCEVLHTCTRGFGSWRGRPLHPDFQARFKPRTVLSLTLTGETFEGHLFFLDLPRMTSDDLMLGEVLARQVTAALDHCYLFQRLQQTAVADERVRLARDLHDGVLQSLTAMALHLESLRRVLGSESQQAHLVNAQELILEEHQHLRSFIEQLRPSGATAQAGLEARVDGVAGRVGRQWNLRVQVRAKGLDGRVPERVGRDVEMILQEGLVNAARHAAASAVHAALAVHGDRVHISVNDDGHGFPFRGHYDHAALEALGLGPVTLRERVAALGGTLTIVSTDTGSSLEIELPLPPTNAPEPQGAARH